MASNTTKPKKGPGRPRDEGNLQRRRSEILDIAAGLFARDGYRSTDLQQVADALGLAKGTLYRYFKSKEDLFLATVDRGVEQLHEYIANALRHVRDPLERLAGGVRAYLAFFRENAGLVELFIQERAEFRGRGKPIYFRRREAKMARWEQSFRELIDGGCVRDRPVGRLVDSIGDVLYGVMFTNHFAGRQKSHDEQANDVLDLIFNGILTDEERRRRAAR